MTELRRMTGVDRLPVFADAEALRRSMARHHPPDLRDPWDPARKRGPAGEAGPRLSSQRPSGYCARQPGEGTENSRETTSC
jgi:hypothetical protein